jgi:formylglycine-generating enzyme required for sulfatase activity
MHSANCPAGGSGVRRAHCEQGLLSPDGYRESLGKGQIDRQYKIKDAVLNQLVSDKVLRREDRLDRFSYELSHDSLAKAVLQSRQQARKRNVGIGAAAMVLLLGWGVWSYRDAGSAQVEAQSNLEAYTSVVQEQLDSGLVKAPTMIEIASGTYKRGSENEIANDDEKPVREVTIQPFKMSEMEVTFEQYDQFAVDTGRDLPSDSGWGRGKQPIINVSWDDAVACAAWLTEKTQPANPYRLPSEAEWEYAARAGSTTEYPWGDAIGVGNANCDGCGSQWDNKQTAPADSFAFAANAFGLYNMHGNVWEWAQDCYHETYNGAPVDGSAWQESDCSLRVLRGGSWDAYPDDLRSALRNWLAPANRGYSLGFRLAQDN